MNYTIITQVRDPFWRASKELIIGVLLFFSVLCFYLAFQSRKHYFEAKKKLEKYTENPDFKNRKFQNNKKKCEQKVKECRIRIIGFILAGFGVPLIGLLFLLPQLVL